MADTNNTSGNQKPTLSWSQPAAKPASAPAAVPTTNAKVAQASSNAGTYIGIFVVGLIVGALVGWGISSTRGGGSSVATTATSTVSTATIEAQKGTSTDTSSSGTIDLSNASQSQTTATADNVTIASTQPAGFEVSATNVKVSQPTWLVVYENHNGTPGNAIGAGLFFAGETSGTIELLRATMPGQTYLVGESLDDGDKIFSLENDKPVRDASGNPLFTQFTAQ